MLHYMQALLKDFFWKNASTFKVTKIEFIQLK